MCRVPSSHSVSCVCVTQATRFNHSGLHQLCAFLLHSLAAALKWTGKQPDAHLYFLNEERKDRGIRVLPANMRHSPAPRLTCAPLASLSVGVRFLNDSPRSMQSCLLFMEDSVKRGPGALGMKRDIRWLESHFLSCSSLGSVFVHFLCLSFFAGQVHSQCSFSH